MPRTVTVELDAAAEAALDALTATGQSAENAIRLALVSSARSIEEAQGDTDARDDMIGLA